MLYFAVLQSVFAQSEKSIKGVVMANTSFLQGVEVVNLNSKNVQLTNAKGEFILEANLNDSILFYSKNFYFKRIKITPELFQNPRIEIEMTVKPEELQEVVIKKSSTIWRGKDSKREQNIDDELKLRKHENRLKTVGVYEGTIENGIDFIQIGTSLLKLLKNKNKESQKASSKNFNFKIYAKSNCPAEYFTQTLKLKPDEVELFLTFCQNDPDSQKSSTTESTLHIMDFLLKKSISFRQQKK